MKYVNLFVESSVGFANYLWSSMITPSWGNYFYYLIGISLLVWGLEIMFPWRKQQRIMRKDFWLDNFYMIFNFFLFNLLGWEGFFSVFKTGYIDFWHLLGVSSIEVIDAREWSPIVQFLILFILADFIQWSVHVALHRFSWLWKFHKVHHSVKEMGFSAHFRYHWMENIFYKIVQFLILSFIGYELKDLFLYHAFTIAIGHLNHANINLNYGPLKYVFNNPSMHIWHHAKELPQGYDYGVNFGITLSVWDYIFKTAKIPYDGRDIELGFEGDETYPDGFVSQSVQGFRG